MSKEYPAGQLSEAEIDRYSRQVILPEVGGKGQKRLQQSSILIVGAGGLGSPSALYLAAAGVGKLGIIDSDVVERNNLQRQILHSVEKLAQAKVASAQDRIHALNPLVQVEPYHERLTLENAAVRLAGYDLVIDGADNFDTKYLLNDTCVALGKPLLFGGVLQYQGQVTMVLPGTGPCLRCLFPHSPDPETTRTCQDAGILGSVAGVIGSLQATEALKYILGIEEQLVGRLLTYNAKTTRFKTIQFSEDPNCPAHHAQKHSVAMGALPC